MMRYILIGCCFFCSLFLSSCNSTKRLGQTATQTSQLSHQLGFKVNRKDDLRLFSEAARWLGTPYRYGSSTRKGVDCSGLVNQIYKQGIRVDVNGLSYNPKTSANLMRVLENGSYMLDYEGDMLGRIVALHVDSVGPSEQPSYKTLRCKKTKNRPEKKRRSEKNKKK